MSTIVVDKADKASVTVIGSTDDRFFVKGLCFSKWKDRLGLLVYVFVQFFAFFFVVFGTPIDMFRLRFVFDPDLIVVTTLWGVKVGVFDTEYALTSREMWSNCTERRDRFYLAQGLAIFSILVYGTAFVLGFIMLYCCSFFRWVCLALNIVGAVTLCVVWGAMVVTYSTDEGPFCPEQKRYHTYGSGFILFILAWILDLLNIVSLLLPF
ncbi:amastin-like protein [Leishmania panamensis]|uniref:Amastin-like protein n=1 Tax=Leishmania panamensis TaxID=5679 RepID=A0AC62A608_LEIPA